MERARRDDPRVNRYLAAARRAGLNPDGEEESLPYERLVFFSDAVFAISITLLALDLKVPDIPGNLAAAELPGRLLDLAPSFFSYVLSFLVIGQYWMAHHGLFRYIRRWDRRLLTLNLLLLLSITFLPFPTAVVGRYGNTRPAVLLYAVSVATTGLLLTLVWLYAAWGGRLVVPGLDAAFVRFHAIRLLAAPAIFLLSIGVAFVNLSLAEWCWVLIVVPTIALNRLPLGRAAAPAPTIRASRPAARAAVRRR
ncbi:MAG TPA: TMEM175 family protein [Thermomicrobiales bacterium]|nr:TMEM175 family protein [Thermomicrobiales bacterium]